MIIKRLLLVLALVASLAFVVAACGDANDSSSGDSAAAASSDGGSADVSGNVAGAGSSAQDAAMQAWIAGLQSTSPDATVSYDPVGSGGGREQFVSKGVDFAGSDSALADDELKGAQERCGGPDNLIEIPVYVSPIAVIYNLDGRRQPAALARDGGARSSPRRSRTGTTRRSPPTTRTPSCPTCASRRSTAPTSPARRQNFTDWLSPDGARRVDLRARRRLARQGRRGRRGHLRCGRCRQERQGHDRLRRREPGRRARHRQDQGRRRVRRAVGRRRRRCPGQVQGDATTPASSCSRSRSTGRSRARIR